MSASFDLGARQQAARLAALRYISDTEQGHTRRRRGRGFSYLDAQGGVLQGTERERIERLAIPPAWTEVWISPWDDAHLLATGRDVQGRKQYIYHPKWRQVRTMEVFTQIPDFARALPALRQKIDRDLRRRAFDIQHVSALATAIMDRTCMRVGNETYAEEHGTKGLTTLACEDLELGSTKVTFDYDAKSGKHRTVVMRDRRLVGQLRRLTRDAQPTRRVFCIDAPDGPDCLDSDGLNTYIQEHTDPRFSAKDFRSWCGTRVALLYLASQPSPLDEAQASGLITEACKRASLKLGNTPAVARAHYIHPGVITAAQGGRMWQVAAPKAELSEDLQALELLGALC